MSASRPRTPPPPPSTSAAQSQGRIQSNSHPPSSSAAPKPPSVFSSASTPNISTQPPMRSRPPERRSNSSANASGRESGGNGNLLSGLLSGSKLVAKARSSVDYITTNAKPVRSALQNASSYIASTAGLIEPVPDSNDKEKTWGEWAREWTERRSQEGKGTEQLNILPGWCVRVERPGVKSDGITPFDLHISTSGFCTYLRSPEYATRSQKVFMRIAKGFAALPRLPDLPAKIMEQANLTSSPQSSPELAKAPLQGGPGGLRDKDSAATPQSKENRQFSTDPAFANMTEAQLRAFHTNLDSRLQPFWSSVLQRRIAITVYTIPLPPAHHHRHIRAHQHDEPILPDKEDEPLIRGVLSTNAQGQFSQKIVVPWERICSHPPSLGMAFAPPPPITGPVPEADGKSSDAWALYIRAELLSEGGPTRLPPSATALPAGQPAKFSSGSATESPALLLADSPSRDEAANAFFSPSAIPVSAGSGGDGGGLLAVGKTTVHSSVVTPVAGSEGVRVISDLDDTVKTSEILSGARAVFRNVFCKSVDEMAVQGMADLYCRLAQEGVAGYHYVSNSPSNLFPVLTDFFNHNPFPRGFSLKLKYYGGGNLINGLFEPAGQRKRPGIIEVMDSFPKAKFVLIGDSGEQDLELYVAIASERPKQVLAILIRDVTSAFAATRRSNNSSSPRSGTPQRSGTSSPKQPPTQSAVDLRMLNEALSEEPEAIRPGSSSFSGSASTSDDESQSKAKLIAQKVLKKTRSWDVPKMTSMSRNDEEGKVLPRSSRRSSSSSLSSVGAAMEDSAVNTVGGASTSTADTEFNQMVEEMGATNSTSLPVSESSEELAEAQHELQVLTAQQLKLQRRAEEWATRMIVARKQLPSDIMLLFFQKPEEVEEVIAAKVRDVVDHWESAREGV